MNKSHWKKILARAFSVTKTMGPSIALLLPYRPQLLLYRPHQIWSQ
jgi:hypothetical protein